MQMKEMFSIGNFPTMEMARTVALQPTGLFKYKLQGATARGSRQLAWESGAGLTVGGGGPDPNKSYESEDMEPMKRYEEGQ